MAASLSTVYTSTNANAGKILVLNFPLASNTGTFPAAVPTFLVEAVPSPSIVVCKVSISPFKTLPWAAANAASALSLVKLFIISTSVPVADKTPFPSIANPEPIFTPPRTVALAIGNN